MYLSNSHKCLCSVQIALRSSQKDEDSDTFRCPSPNMPHPTTTEEGCKTHHLDEFRLDVLVEHELRKDEELFREELVRKVDGRVHDAGAVRADRVGDVSDVDRVQVLVVTRTLHKDL